MVSVATSPPAVWIVGGGVVSLVVSKSSGSEESRRVGRKVNFK